MNEGEVGLRKDPLLSEAAWGRTWPDHDNTDRPVGSFVYFVCRFVYSAMCTFAHAIDAGWNESGGAADEAGAVSRRQEPAAARWPGSASNVRHAGGLQCDQIINAQACAPPGLRFASCRQDRAGNRVDCRRRGEGGLFRGKDGEWLKRMWKIKAWSEPGGGIHGGMSSAAANCSEKHHPVGDGWAPPRQLADGWGAKKLPQKGSHNRRGKSNQVATVTHFGRAPAKRGTPEDLKPGCWRGKCKFPHGEDARDDLIHGLPYEGACLRAC